MVSCNKAPEHLKMIPKDVTAVAAIDFKQIAKKSVEFNDLFKLDTWKKITGNDSTFAKIQNSGIDLSTSAYIFGDGPKAGSQGYGAVAFAVKDAEKITATLKAEKNNIEVKEENGYKYAVDEKIAIVYNDKVGVLYIAETSADKLKSEAFAIIATTEENSLASSNDKFKDLIKKGSDIGIFVNYERAMDIAKTANPMAAPISINYKDMALIAGINFENGQIVTDYSIYSNKENAEKYKDAARANVSSDVQDAHPGNVIAAFAVALNLKTVVTVLQEQKLLEGVDQNLEMMLGQGFNIEFFTTAFSGDILASVNGLRTKDGQKYDWETQQLVPSKEPAFDFAVTLGVADEAKVQSLLDVLATKGMLQKTDDSYSIMGKFFLAKKKGAITLAGEEAYGKDYVAGKTPKLDGRAKELIAGNSAVFIADFTKVPGDVLELIDPKAKEYVANMPLATIEMYSEKPSGEVSSGKVLVNFKNKDQNALISLQQMIKDSEKYIPATPAPTAYAEDSVSVQVDTTAAEIIEEPVQ